MQKIMDGASKGPTPKRSLSYKSKNHRCPNCDDVLVVNERHKDESIKSEWCHICRLKFSINC